MLLDLLFIPLIVIAGFLFTNYLDREKTVYLRNLWLYHVIISLYVCFFLKGDSVGYWSVPKSYNYDTFRQFIFNSEGTYFMYALNYPFSNIFAMSYLSNTLLFALFGFIGLSFFFKVALQEIRFNRVIYGYAVFPLVFFLPNLHIWSAGIGKDTLMFMCIGMFAYGVLSPVKRIPLIILALFMILAIRPHVALFLFLGFGLAYLFDGKVTTTQRILFSIVLLAGSIVVLPQVLSYIKLESLDVSAISDRAGTQAEGLARGSGSGVDISGYPLPLKIFTFLYRPLFFDARSFGTLLSSLDNLILLLLSWHAFRFRPLETFRMAPFVLKGFLLFGIIGTLGFSISLGNLGVMVRMKNMFTPGILIYFMWCYSYRFQFEYAQKKAAENVKKLRLKMKAKKGENKPVTE